MEAMPEEIVRVSETAEVQHYKPIELVVISVTLASDGVKCKVCTKYDVQLLLHVTGP